MPAGTPDPTWILRNNEGPVSSLLFIDSSDDVKNGCLCIGTQTGVLSVCNLKTRRHIHKLEAHFGQSILWMFNPNNGKFLISQGRDGWIHWWDLSSNLKKSDSFEYGVQGFCPCEYVDSPESANYLLTPTSDSAVNVVDCASKKIVKTLCPADGKKAYGMCMSMRKVEHTPERSLILVSYEDGSVSLWNILTQNEINHAKLHEEPAMCLDYSAVLQKGITGSTDTVVKMWKSTVNHEFDNQKDIDITNKGINSVRFRSDGKLFAAGGSDGKVRLFSKSGKKLAVLEYHRESVQYLAFDHTNTLAVGCKDGAVSFWNLY